MKKFLILILLALASVTNASDFAEHQIESKDSSSVDAFQRWRVSNPTTLFDSKQIFDNQPLFWDEELETGAGITSAHSVNEASTTITSTISTAGVFTRQTFMRFNYQPGKSQLVMMTGVLDETGGGTGTERRIGIFDDDNGLFFEFDDGIAGVTRRSNVTGSPVDDTFTQANWNVDIMDGTGPSGKTMDFTKFQIFFIDFEWLGAGRVRMCIVIDGMIFAVHEFLAANVLNTVYMSTPNLPLRYQMVTTSSSPVATMVSGCSTVVSEGGTQLTGVLHHKSTSGVHLDADVENTLYAVIGIRLKSTHIGATVELLNVSLIEFQGSKFYEWVILFNPTVAGVFTYSAETDAATETALGATANTVTGGMPFDGDMVSSAQKGGSNINKEINNALRLGADISGNVDEIVLCVRPIGGSTNIDIEATFSWQELN